MAFLVKILKEFRSFFGRYENFALEISSPKRHLPGYATACYWMLVGKHMGPSLYYVSKGTLWVGSEKVQKFADVI